MEMPLIHALFEEQVERTPQALAAVCASRYITYQDLNVQANQLAHLLKTVGVGPGVLVAVYMDRSLDMLPALLGILKAGGAYVPLETTFPPARIQWILSSLHITILITHQTVLTALSPVEYQMLDHIICLDRSDDQPELQAIHLWTRSHLERLSGNNLPPQASAQDLAYIIFTSGSTGTPKGVMVCHQPILNLIDWV